MDNGFLYENNQSTMAEINKKDGIFWELELDYVFCVGGHRNLLNSGLVLDWW